MRRLFLAAAAGLLVASAAVLAPPTVVGAVPAPITGTVFRDNNQNGARDDRDVGLADVVVIATDAAGIEAGRATTVDDGTYSLAGTDTTANYRIAFEWGPSYLRPSAVGPDSGSTVQFASGGATVNFALANPADYCNANEETVQFAVTCFVNGNSNNPAELNGQVETIVSSVRGNGIAGTDTPPVTELATAADTGSVYGLAYQPITGRLFTSAFLKRHVGLGSGGINAFYVSDTNTGVVSLWYDSIDAGLVESNADRGLPDDPADDPTSLDANVFGQIGKAGWGDIDFNEDTSVLYATNLFDREIYAIDVAAADQGSTAAHASIGRPPITCPNGVDRPFALKIRDGFLYSGVTCTAENGGTRADLSAHVFAYDIDAGTWAAQSMLDIPLDYDDGCLLRDQGCEMHPWEDNFSYANFFFTANPGSPYEFPLRAQPILADIEFDTDDSLIIGIRDRQADQFGHRNLTPNGDGNLVTSAANGDILRAAPPDVPGGKWVLESGGVVGGRTSSGTGTERFGPGGPNSGQGPGGGEFYWSDFVANAQGDAFHSENFMGSLAAIPGADTTAATQIDPVDGRLDAGGIIWLNHDTGANDDSLEIYRDASTPQPSTLGKANGLGDIEALCLPPPVQIGNRAWFDRDKDGIQDPDEPPIPGLTVRLSDGQTTTTDASGTWSFFVQPFTDYEVTFETATADVSGIPDINIPNLLSGTLPNEGVDDEIDSDMDPLTLTIPVTSKGYGEHDHSFDAGFVPGPMEIGNLVWNDIDNDGMAETGEPGIANVRVQLWRDLGLDGVKETMVDEQLTDANGRYLFTGQPVGAYGVLIPNQFGAGEALFAMRSSTPTEADGDSDVDNDDNGIDPPLMPDDLMSSVIQLTGPEPINETIRKDDPTPDPPSAGFVDVLSNLTIDFGFYQPASIGDRVWLDDDANGLQDPGELGVPDVTVNLCDANGVTVQTTTTDANGIYTFEFLTPGAYKVCFDLGTLPADQLPTAQYAGGDDSLDSDANPFTGMTDVTLLDPLEDDPNWDLGIILASQVYEIGNLVWLDADNDGMAIDGEPGINGVAVELYADDGSGAKGALLAGTSTDANGKYRFTNLPAGKYLVNIPDQSGEGQALARMTSSVPTEANPDTDSDNDDNGLNPAANADGVMSNSIMVGDEAEPLQEQQRKDDAAGETTNLADNRSNLTVDFGFYRTASLGQSIWVDANRDGIRDPGELPISGIVVNLCDSSGATATTGADGDFLFEGLDPGEYRLCLDLTSLPPGYTVTAQDAGDNDVDSDVDPVTGMTDVVTLGAGEALLNLFIGLLPPASLGDKVWFDTDADGIQDPDEDPVPGVTVNLCDDAMTPLATTVTDANGMYIFEGLAPGEYMVCFDLSTIPVGATPTTADAGGDDAADSDADTRTGKTPGVLLLAGEHNPTLDMGIVPPPILAVTGTNLTGFLVGVAFLLVGSGVGFFAFRRLRLSTKPGVRQAI